MPHNEEQFQAEVNRQAASFMQIIQFGGLQGGAMANAIGQACQNAMLQGIYELLLDIRTLLAQDTPAAPVVEVASDATD